MQYNHGIEFLKSTTMKKSTQIFVLILLSLMFARCSKSEDVYSLGDIWISLGFVETEYTNGYDYILYCDNGDTLFPVASNVYLRKTANAKRVFINYTVLDEVGISENTFYVKVNSLNEILYKDPIELTEINTDSLGYDLVTITDT
jgi:hypothetical protein